MVKHQQVALLEKAMQIGFDYIGLDECSDAIQLHMLQEEDVISFIEHYQDKEIVMTGRNPSEQLKERADYITEMKMEKQFFQKHITARKGVEY